MKENPLEVIEESEETSEDEDKENRAPCEGVFQFILLC